MPQNCSKLFEKFMKGIRFARSKMAENFCESFSALLTFADASPHYSPCKHIL